MKQLLDILFKLPGLKQNPLLTDTVQFMINRNYVCGIDAGQYANIQTYGFEPRINFQKLYYKVIGETKLYQSEPEAYQMHMAVRETQIANIPGDIAEVGVFWGGSAKIISNANSMQKNIYLFDTFEGIPSVGKNDVAFKQGEFLADYDTVADYLSKERNIHIYKGLFPSTADVIKDKKFSFVHIDADTYQSITDSLEFFWPRMNTGGIVIVHDYLTSRGARLAVTDFFWGELGSPVLEAAGDQAMVVKVKK